METLREQLIAEIQHIPPNRLQETFDLIHFFRLGLDHAQHSKSSHVSQFAGAWADMDDAVFADLESEWQERRQQVFSGRNFRTDILSRFLTRPQALRHCHKVKLFIRRLTQIFADTI